MCSTLNFGGLVKQSFDFCPKSPNAKFTTGSIKCSRRTLHRRSRRPYTLTPLLPTPVPRTPTPLPPYPPKPLTLLPSYPPTPLPLYPPIPLTPLSPYPRLISTGGTGGARRAARRGFSGVITMLPGITHQGRITSPLTAFT
jgi:hypothetical protein